MAEFVTIAGASVGLADLQSPIVLDCLGGAEWHAWSYPSDDLTCHNSKCRHVRCRDCGIERIIYDVKLRVRDGLADDLNKACLSWLASTVRKVPVFKVLVIRYVRRQTPADASMVTPTPA